MGKILDLASEESYDVALDLPTPESLVSACERKAGSGLEI